MSKINPIIKQFAQEQFKMGEYTIPAIANNIFEKSRFLDKNEGPRQVGGVR